MRSPRALLAAPLVIIAALVLSACVSVANPQGWGSPVFDDGSVVLQESKEHIAAVRLADAAASRTWVFPDKDRGEDKDLKLKGIYGAPVIAEGVVYFSSFDAGIFALNKADGRPIWRLDRRFDGNVVAGVAVAEGKLAFATTEGDLFVLDAKDGKPSQGWPSGGVGYKKGVWTAPVIKDGVVYVATMDGQVDALKLTDGSRVWAAPFETTGAIAGLQLLEGDRLFAPSLNKYVYILDIADGRVVRDFKAKDWVWSGAAFKDNVVYFGDFSGNAYALDITSGADRWNNVSLGKDRVKAGPAIVDDVVVFGDRGPAVHFFKASDGSRLGIGVPLTGAGTIRADLVAREGSVYALTTSGRLFKADPKTQTVNEVTIAGARQ
ncbi:MAG: hypothetical protein C0506_01360 [Anaerolinea sp.]|nr:hypothetical protein [Anaerolinea sp.]